MSGLNQSPDRSDVLDSAFVHGTINVGNSDVIANVSGTNLAKRQTLVIYNDSNKDMFYGPSGVSSSGGAKGILFSSQETVTLNIGEFIDIFIISSTPGANKAIIQEFA